jgi:hypothetical protein
MTLEERATLAAQLTGQAAFWMHSACVAETRAQKVERLVKGFKCWSLAARHMGLLEQLAPNCAREGYDEAARIRDFVEAREG